MTEVVAVDLGKRSYDILIEPGLLGRLGKLLRERTRQRKLFVITNPTVGEHYLAPVKAQLETSGFSVVDLMIPDGETAKNLHTVENIYTYLIAEQADRQSLLVALGGGVTGDVVGFVAATFLRGVPYIQIPTTLLAQVDSSVGGKTGVNHPLGKNLIGAFYQPYLVCIDPDTLATLPEREYRAGLYEVVKYGLIYDAAFFAYLEEHLDALQRRDGPTLVHVIRRCCEIKAAVISEDETEAGLRRILNFGHTFGHALEAATNYERFKHGEAVAYGMVAAALLSHDVSGLPESHLNRICSIVRALGPVPSAADIAYEDLREAMNRDKKRQADRLVFVLLPEIGRTEMRSGFDEDLLTDVWARAIAKIEGD
ncbi:MAG: 3-dehydroquinate synthase [Acidobacteriota bacterium]